MANASTRIQNQRNQTARRRQERADQRHAQYMDRSALAHDQREIRRQRSDYIDSIPGLGQRARYDLHHTQAARTNAGQYVEDKHAQRLREFDEALATGARSVQGHRMAQYANRFAEAEVGQQEAITRYMPMSIRANLNATRANTRNTRSLADARDADTARQDAIAPLERDRAGLENDMLRSVAPRVQDGTVLPPNFRNDVRVPAGLNALDEARAFDLETRGMMHLSAMEAASRPERPSFAERVRALTTIVNADGASREEKDEARRELAEIAAYESAYDAEDAAAIDISTATDIYEDDNGQKVYALPDGSYRYADGRHYTAPGGN